MLLLKGPDTNYDGTKIAETAQRRRRVLMTVSGCRLRVLHGVRIGKHGRPRDLVDCMK